MNEKDIPMFFFLKGPTANSFHVLLLLSLTINAVLQDKVRKIIEDYLVWLHRG